MTDERFWELADDFESEDGKVPFYRIQDLVNIVRQEDHDDWDLIRADMDLFHYDGYTESRMHAYLAIIQF